jgi:hypothetical protein
LTPSFVREDGTVVSKTISEAKKIDSDDEKESEGEEEADQEAAEGETPRVRTPLLSFRFVS